MTTPKLLKSTEQAATVEAETVQAATVRAETVRAELADAEKSKNSLMLTPLVLQIVAEKR